MTDLSPYELRVLRKMAKGGDKDLICGAALWVAIESLERRGLVELTGSKPEPVYHPIYHPTPAGRALVRARALDELMASDAELTEGNNVR